MPSFREYTKKLQSLRSMRRVTRTMKMVAAGHLRRAQAALAHARLYRDELRDIAGAVAAAARDADSLRGAAPGDLPNVLLVVITSDRGLCGGFNHNVVRRVDEWIREHQPRCRKLRASFIGQRGHAALRHRIEVRRVHDDVATPPDSSDALRIGLELCGLFRAGKYHEIHMAYTRFYSPMRHEAVIERLLPFDRPSAPEAATGGKPARPVSFLMEPDPATLATRLMSVCVRFHLYDALLNSAASEHGARMLAMDSATGNIDKLSTRYTLLRNTARQAAITRELIEIVSGAEALKG